MKKRAIIQRILALILTLSLSFSVMSVTAAAAHIEIPGENNGGECETQSVSGVLVFIAGILAGYVIDGVFVYATGYSAAELTSMAISRILGHAENSTTSRIHVDEDGNIIGGSTSGKFSYDYGMAY